MHGENISYAYGFWSLVAVNVGLFAFFIISFLSPVKKKEWRCMGATLAFFVALFTEMYGFPLTIYILTGLLGSKYPVLNPFSHNDDCDPCHQQWPGDNRIFNYVDGLETDPRCKRRSGYGWPLCLCKASAILGPLYHHDRDADPVADYYYRTNVPGPHLRILSPVKERRRRDD